MLKPIKKTSLAEDIIGSIKELINIGELKPGDKLPGERDLSVMLKVSRASVREALRAMSVAGLTTTKHGDGTYLNATAASFFDGAFRNCFDLFLQLRDYVQFIETRRILETNMVDLAAQRMGLSCLEELEHLLWLMKGALQNNEVYYQLDIRFHNCIYQAAENEILSRISTTLNELFEQIMHAVFTDVAIDPGIQISYDQHIKLFHAVREHDSNTAIRLMKQHLDHADHILHQHLKNNNYY